MFLMFSSLFNPEPGVIMNGGHTLTVDELMKMYARRCDGGSICLICRKKIFEIRRHMREIHLSSGEDYYCPTCDKFFKNRSAMYNHIRRKHEEWKGVAMDSFAVKK